MREPEAALTRLAVLWRRQAGQWLGGGGEWPLALPLQPPGERRAMSDWDGFRAWRDSWAAWRGPGQVLWSERRWPSLGKQAVPERWQLANADEVATALGQTRRWTRAVQRRAEAVARWPRLDNWLRRHVDWLADTADSEWQRLGAMFAWLLAHPDSGLFARQLPVAGLNSKWLEAHTGLLGQWLQAQQADAEQRGFWPLSGLRREADRLRLRVLDPALRQRVGGLGDIQTPLDELARLDWAPRTVFIVENKQTGLAFTDLPGSVVLLARGYAIDRLHQFPWLQQADRLCYWGDLDTHGLAILGRLRGHLPRLESLLMDEATLHACRALWVQEPTPHGADRIAQLDDAEQALYRDLKRDRFGPRVRLEQERIAWDHAWPVLRAAAR